MGMRFGGGMSSGKPDETTTITINTFKSDRNRLNHLRHYPREPYRAIVRRLLDQSGDSNSGVLGTHRHPGIA